MFNDNPDLLAQVQQHLVAKTAVISLISMDSEDRPVNVSGLTL